MPHFALYHTPCTISSFLPLSSFHMICPYLLPSLRSPVISDPLIFSFINYLINVYPTFLPNEDPTQFKPFSSPLLYPHNNHLRQVILKISDYTKVTHSWQCENLNFGLPDPSLMLLVPHHAGFLGNGCS